MNVRDLAGVAILGEVEVSDRPLAPRQLAKPGLDGIRRGRAFPWGERRQEGGDGPSARLSTQSGKTKALSNAVGEGSRRNVEPQARAALMKKDQRFLGDVLGLEAASEEALRERGQPGEVRLHEQAERLGF